MARPQKTLADFVVIAISPALIMVLIASLVFFLVEVFYHGAYQARLLWIFGLFILAAVLIARISIEEGREYACLFAVPLGLVTLLAVFRFVEFSGGLAGLRVPLNIGLVALIWWCADRLTWDCTVIDERQDASGQGLLQTAGLDRPAAAGASVVATAQDVEATSSHDALAPRKWWERFVEYRRRPHAPGVWVIYFSLAALPLFGLCQRFIPAQQLASRRWAFWMLTLYVFSGLALLMTTSFLGLRRYLRQRRLAMPVEMAGVWLGLGSVLIVALLLVCNILPRPSSEYSVTQLSFPAGSSDNVRPSPVAVGKDGAKPDVPPPSSAVVSERAPDPGGASAAGGQAQGGAGQPGQRSGGAAKPAGGDQAQGQAAGKDPSAGSASAAAQQPPRSQPAAASDGGAAKPAGGDPAQGQAAGKDQSAGSAGAAAQQPPRSPPAGASDGGATKPAGGDQAQGQPPGTPKQDPAAAAGTPPSSPAGTPDRPRQAAAETGPDQAGQDAARPQAQDPDQAEPPTSSPTQPQSTFSPTQMLNTMLGGVPQMLKWLYHLLFFLIVGYFLWRYRAQVWAALANFLQALREFWERLLGGRKPAPAAPDATPVTPAAPPRPFADFADPFLAGGYTPQELVVHSFQALEAWSRERGCLRGAEQTPHEFARQLGARTPALAADARNLAELYCQAAYSTLPLPPQGVESLRQLWQALRNPAA